MGKLKSKIMSAVLAASFLFSQIGVDPISVVASAEDTVWTAEKVAKDVFSFGNYPGHAFFAINLSNKSITPFHETNHDGISWTASDTVILDPRVTGTFRLDDDTAINDDVDHSGAPAAGQTKVPVTRGDGIRSYTINRSGSDGAHKGTGSDGFPTAVPDSSGINPTPTKYVFRYTPSAEDVKRKIAILWIDCYFPPSYSGTSTASTKNDLLYITSSYASSGWLGKDYVAGKTYIIESWDKSTFPMGRSFIVTFADVVDYAYAAYVGVQTPTTFFSSPSVPKIYYDDAFDSGFTTNSTGAKTFDSSDKSVATIDSTGKITIVGTGPTKITGSTAANNAYSASSAKMTLIVDKATPTLTNISAQGITYGQTLANSKITCTAKVGTHTVDGTFTWKDATSTAPSAGSHLLGYTFTPKDTKNINSVSGKVFLSVGKKDGYLTGVTATGITYGQTLGSSVINHTDGISGTFTWKTPSVKPDAGTRTYEYTFTPTDSTNYAPYLGTVSVAVAKADPTISATPKNAITYGQTLDSAGINGTATGVSGETLSGAWSYVNASTIPSVSDSGSTAYTITFTPNSTNYNPKSVNVTIQVTPATLTTGDVVVSSAPITFGRKLSDSALTLVSSKTPGRVEWVNGDVTPSVTDSGVTQYAVRFTPDSANYKSLDLTATVVVNKASPAITPTIKNTLSTSEITYGQTLADSRITGDTPVPGYYTWSNPDIAPSVANSESTEYDVTFIPSDETNYSRSTTKLTVKVNPYTAQFTSDIKASLSTSQITYGDTLSMSTITGTAPVDMLGNPISGSYVWVDSSEAPEVADSNRTKYDVVFKPTDSVNYTEVSGVQLTVSVIKATPVVTPEMEATIQATTITFNQSLADSQLSGTTPIAGHYEWVDDTIEPSVADSNVTEYSVRFVPDDLDNNNIVEGIICKLIINKATPDVNSVMSSISASDITYNDTLADSAITGDLPLNAKGAEIAGSYAWTAPDTKPGVSDSNLTPYSMIFTPDDSDNYNSATFSLTLTVNKADIIISGDVESSVSASDIVYEQSLADSVLTGTMPTVNGSELSGHYEWADSSIKPSVSDSDSTQFEVVFKPDDSINYNDVTGLYTALNIAKLTPVVEPSVLDTVSASGIIYGQSLGNSVISGNTPRPGHWEWVNADATPNVADSNVTEFEITWIPDDIDNYNPATAMLKLEVSKATPAVDPAMLTVGDIIWGTKLGDASLLGDYPTLNGVEITGTYSWLSADAVLDAGDQVVRVLFTPDDLNNFTTTEVEVTIHINPLVPTFTPEIMSTIKASDITYGQTLASAILSGDVPVAGHYEWKAPDTLPTVADSNLTAFDVVFIPDSSNYASVDLVCTLFVGKKVVQVPSSMAQGIVVGELTYGQHLGEASLTGDTPIPGRYMWIDSNVMPTVDGENRYMVIFVPDDNDNYGLVEVGKKHVVVRKATPAVDLLHVLTSGITYGQSLADSVISYAGTMPGTFTWADDTIKPAISDSDVTLYDAIYHPDDIVNYTDANIQLTVTVLPVSVVLPADIENYAVASAIKFGQSLGDSNIMLISRSSGTIPAGHFEWVDPSIKPAMSDSDVTKYSVKFVPDDTNYSSADTELTIHVDKGDLPAEYVDMTDTVALKPGASTVYSISNKFRCADASVTGIIKTDSHNILETAKLVGNSIELKAVGSSAVEGQSAEIVFTIASRDYVDAKLTLTVVVTACDHSGGTHIEGYVAPTNSSKGYTGDKICNICGATVEFGHEIPALQDNCSHEHTHIENRASADCITDGYTGDTVCDNCGKTIKKGTIIPKTGHVHTHVENKVKPTCQSEGYTGDVICDTCGTIITKGTVQAKISHIEGSPVVVKAATRTETGLRAWYCTMCNTELRTEVIPKLSSGGGGSVRPSRPVRPTDPTDDPTDPVNPDKPDPDKPCKPNPDKPNKPDPDKPNKPDPDKPDAPDPNKPDPDKPDGPVTEEPTDPATDEPGEDEPTVDVDEPTSETDEPGDSDEPMSDTDEPTGDSDEPTSDSDASDDSDDSNDTFESGDSKDTDDSDDSKSDDSSDSDDSNSDDIPDKGIIKQVGIADGVYEHTPDDGHTHHFARWVIRSGNPYPVYDHICEDCGLIEEVASDTDPNTWGTDSDNPYTGVDTMPVAISGLSAVLAVALVLLFRTHKNN